MAVANNVLGRVSLVDSTGADITSASSSLDLAPQTLSGTGRLIWDVTGMSTLSCVVTGTAVMTVRYIGTNGNPNTATTSNRPWKLGASLGTNIVGYSGTVSTEYRLVGGRKYFVVECTSYTSGSLTFQPYAIQGSAILYVGGGVQTVIEEASIQGNMFNAATSFLSVPANNYGQVVFENPAGSNKLAIIRERRFSTNANSGAFGGVSAPTAATFDNQTGGAAPIALTPSNLRTGSAAVPSPASAMSVKYNIGTTRIDSSPSNTNPPGDFLAANFPFTLDVLRIVPPGTRFGHFVGGAGGGLAVTALVSLYLLWEERDLF